MAQAETVLLSVHTGIVKPVLVPNEGEQSTYESIMDEIDANAPTPVPRARSSREFDLPTRDSQHSITLIISVPDVRRMAYASEEMVNSSVSPEAIQLRLPIALAKTKRRKKASGFPVGCK